MLKLCVKCILDNTEVPEILFDAQGICNFCREWERGEKERKSQVSDLQWVYARMRTKDKYDCLLGLSGGVDSSLCLHYLIENGIRPLCFTVDNGWNDPKADENIMRLVEGLKVPFYRYVIDQERFKELQAAFLQSGTKNVEIPTDHVLMAVSYEMADKYGIKTIVGGGNHATEGIMPEAYGYNARDLSYILGIFRRFAGKKLTGLPTIFLLKYLYFRFIKKVRVVNLLDYYSYNRAEAKKILTEKYGWKDYGGKHEESVWTTWFQNFWLLNKWRLDKRKPHLSSLINSGQMTRSEALVELGETPVYPILGIEARAMGYPKKDYSDYPNAKKWWDLLSRIYALGKKRQ